jgi:hypothetical protein
VTDRSDDASLVEDPSSPAEELVLPAPTDPVRDARAELAAQLVDQARTEGISLVGPDGVLAEVTKLVLEAGLEVEMDEHLGYAKHAAAGRDGGNSRNGRRTKTVLTGVGPVEIMVPRDRGGTFEPVTVRKRQRRLGDVDTLVLSLSARSLTTGQVASRAFCAAIGVTVDGKRDIIGLCRQRRHLDLGSGDRCRCRHQNDPFGPTASRRGPSGPPSVTHTLQQAHSPTVELSRRRASAISTQNRSTLAWASMSDPTRAVRHQRCVVKSIDFSTTPLRLP